MFSKFYAAILVSATLTACALIEPLAGVNYNWDRFTATGEVYEFEGKRYDVYKGVATGIFQGEDVERRGTVLFPEGTSRASRKAVNVAAVCWEGDRDPCNVSFGKQLTGPAGTQRAEGMGY